MRLALIAPPSPWLVNARAYPPLGLGCLSAYVKREMPEVEVKIICLEPEQEVPGGFDVYGFTATSMEYHDVVELAEDIAGRKATSWFILGGPHATVAPNSISPIFDRIVHEEGERALVHCLRDIRNKKQCRFYDSPRIHNLDSLPFPDRDFGVEFDNVVVMASRGCPYRCSFCATQTMWPGATRWRSPGNVVAEIAILKERGAKTITMKDDTLTANGPWLGRFCERIKPLGIEWTALARADHAAPETMRMMYNAGCREVRIGVESFDPHVLKALNKGTTPDANAQAVINSHAAGLKVWLLLMIGTPGESKKTVDRNKYYCSPLADKVYRTHISTFMPLLGTPIWNDPWKYGIEIVDKDYSHYNHFWWGPKGENPPWSPIRIDGMTYQQQLQNITEMREWIRGRGIMDKGETP